MSEESFRKKRDSKTIEVMIRIYCQRQHSTYAGLCPECEELLRYATKRINQCPLKERKTTCAQCSVHCYTPIMREKIRKVMRYSGPRMMYKHPILTFFHLFDGLKPKFKRNKIQKHREYLYDYQGHYLGACLPSLGCSFLKKWQSRIDAIVSSDPVFAVNQKTLEFKHNTGIFIYRYMDLGVDSHYYNR